MHLSLGKSNTSYKQSGEEPFSQIAQISGSEQSSLKQIIDIQRHREACNSVHGATKKQRLRGRPRTEATKRRPRRSVQVFTAYQLQNCDESCLKLNYEQWRIRKDLRSKALPTSLLQLRQRNRNVNRAAYQEAVNYILKSSGTTASTFNQQNYHQIKL